MSIALCTYNGERYIDEQLASLLAQDYSNLEIVVRDDGSRDSTAERVAAHMERDSRIRLIRNPSNLGFTRNFEQAILDCRGELIAPCDQDDVWSPHKISALVAALEHSKAALAYCDSEFIDAEGRPLGRRISDKILMESTSDPLSFVFSNVVSGHAMLFRRTLLERALPFPRDVFHDWWLAFVAAASGGTIYVDRSLVRYRQHADAVTDLIGARPKTARSRPRGWRRKELEVVEHRIAHFARLSCSDQLLLETLLRLWRQRGQQLVSPKLTCFMLKYRDRLFAFHRNTRLRRVRRALQHFWGLRLKRWVSPHRYADVA